MLKKKKLKELVSSLNIVDSFLNIICFCFTVIVIQEIFNWKSKKKEILRGVFSGLPAKGRVPQYLISQKKD